MSASIPVVSRDESGRPRRLSDVFVCEYRNRRMYLATCLDDFMNANALRVRSMVCHECTQGSDNRQTFAADADSEGLLDAEIWGKLISEFNDAD